MPDFESASLRVHGNLQDAGHVINETVRLLDEELENLRTKLQPLIQTWAAQSADEYQLHMHHWDQAAVALYGDEAQGGVLGTIAAMMHVNWTNYADAEAANLKTWTSAN
ncbi:MULTISPECIES: WXG100 family type VII secretion target [Streptomyces]|uniref:WXG100 family type VII secretion target n=1 Tax=Streptomyces TaxID=1883 RepID=UPI00210E5ED2|nr:WXG100 family type VII secretion target [Streptomyces longispororuber]MCQ4213303.1 WXG100 family type VII secretion target [Streptomyces longispororuber]